MEQHINSSEILDLIPMNEIELINSKTVIYLLLVDSILIYVMGIMSKHVM
jgi:hypothetical protein